MRREGPDFTLVSRDPPGRMTEVRASLVPYPRSKPLRRAP